MSKTSVTARLNSWPRSGGCDAFGRADASATTTSTSTTASRGQRGLAATCGIWSLPVAPLTDARSVTYCPTTARCATREDLIIDWWDTAYRGTPTFEDRFRLEAKARLPAIDSTDDLEDVFAAVAFQRLRLSHDQQIPEWGGPIAGNRGT